MKFLYTCDIERTDEELSKNIFFTLLRQVNRKIGIFNVSLKLRPPHTVRFAVTTCKTYR